MDKAKILLVDDVASNLKVLAKLLDHYQLFLATSAQEALAILHDDHKIDLILLDVLMPVMDGYELCRLLKSSPNSALSSIPIIFITARDTTESESRGLHLGAVDFLTKPIRPDIVLGRVKTHLELKRQRDVLDSWAKRLEQMVRERTSQLHTTIDHLSREIVQRCQMEEELVVSRARLQAIVDTAGDAIITMDAQGIIEFVNDAAERMFGYGKEEMIGQNVTLLMADGDKKNHPYYLQRYLASGHVIPSGQTREVIGCKRDGVVFPIELGIAALKLGERQLFTGILRDISLRKNAEHLAIRNARLASLGTLAAGVAHEIDNPNNAIGFAASAMAGLWQELVPFLSELAEDRPSVSVRGLPLLEGMEIMTEMIKEAGDNFKRIANIIANLKHMAKGDEGKLDQMVEIHKVLHTAVNLLQKQIQKHTDHFSVTVAPDLPPVRGNQQQLEQVFINLIQNGLQSLPTRNKALTITVTMVDEDATILVTIRDEGCGMTVKDLERITKPFYTTKGAEGGIGLGLSITKTILNNHHGALSFESKPNCGTRVTVQLPVYQLTEKGCQP